VIDRPAVILDCDPGHDDVIAIAVAAQHTELVGISTVAGNAALDRCTENALAVTELCALEVEVHEGADRPLQREPRHAPTIHGESGLAGTNLPPTTRSVAQPGAVEWMLEASRQREGLWIIATGPLTNVALALRADAGFASRIAGISIMGGGISFGNVTPVAEFNIWFDPEAAAIVFAAGVPMRMCGLDVTHQVLVHPEHVTGVRALGGPIATFMADALGSYAGAHEGGIGPLHDPCAVLALTHPDLFTFEPLHVAVETRGRLTAGMTVADRRDRTRRLPENVYVAMQVDASAVLTLVHDAIALLR
jgi:inosine-uridine nucleoside N-ribohydrolase